MTTGEMKMKTRRSFIGSISKSVVAISAAPLAATNAAIKYEKYKYNSTKGVYQLLKEMDQCDDKVKPGVDLDEIFNLAYQLKRKRLSNGSDDHIDLLFLSRLRV